MGDSVWQPSQDGHVPTGALWIGKDVNGKDLYAGRVVTEEGATFIGKVGLHYKGCWYIHTETGREILSTTYDVLCIPGERARWVPISFPRSKTEQSDSDDDFSGLDVLDPSFDGSSHKSKPTGVPEIPVDKALSGGKDSKGPLYVARMSYKYATHPGVAAPHLPEGCAIAYAGKQTSTNFEILVDLTDEPEIEAANQRQEFLEAVDTKMKQGDRYAVVAKEWMSEWLTAVRLNEFFTDPVKNVAYGQLPTKRIFNRRIADVAMIDSDQEEDIPVDEGLSLSRKLREYEDYFLVPEAAYAKLKQWYGSDVDFIRPVFDGPAGVSVELYPLNITVLETGPDGEPLEAEEVIPLKKSWTWEDYAKYLVSKSKLEEAGEESLVEGVQSLTLEEGEPGERSDDDPWQSVRLWWWESPLPKGPGADDGKTEETEGRWQIFGPKIREQKISDFQHVRVEIQKIEGVRILVERSTKTEDGEVSWPREVPKWDDFQVGQVIDALDDYNKWYEGLIESIEEDSDGDKILGVHYLGWARKYDMKINTNQKKQSKKVTQYMLAPRNTHTTGIYFKPPPKPKMTYGGYSGGGYGYGYGGWGYSRTSTKGTPKVPGAVGLINLGNTCFMNSTLSCLLHTRPLKAYLLSDKWKEDLNRDSVLGWKGEAAVESAALMKEYWSNEYKIVAPTKFKTAVGKYKPRFAGYAQQDSSELLSELLDGLDEDLNLVRKKAMTEKIESDGRPDAEVAQLSWENHLIRNKSVIVDIFTGQIKSTVDCPDCPRVSVTFDPITYFSVPLPTVRDRVQTVYVKFADPAIPITKFGVNVSQTDFMHMMKKSLAPMASEVAGRPVNSAALFAADIWNRKVHRWVDELSVSNILANDVIVLYEAAEDVYIPQPPTQFALDGEQLSNEEQAAQSPAAAAAALASQDPSEFRLADSLPVAIVNQTRDPQHGYRSFGQPVMIPIHYRGEKSRNCDIAGGIHRVMYQFLSPEAQQDYNEFGRVPYRILVRDGDARYCGYHTFGSCECELPLDKEGFPQLLERYAGTPTLDVTFVLRWEDPAAYDGTSVDPKNWAMHESVDPAKRGASAELDEGRPKAGRTTLSACLDAFTQEEILEESEAWYCRSCKDHKCAKKKFDLWRLPEVAIIHLKRFHYTRVYREKVNTFVDFPLDGLSLKQWCKNPEHDDDIYDLFAVSNHIGGMGGGHYTAYVKNSNDGKWYIHDDESVRELGDPSEVVSSQAYLLFYQRRPKKQ